MKNSNTIPLDFYVPVKDGEPFLAECLTAILGQSLLPQRIVVYVNRYSKDRTLEIAKSFPVEVREVFVPLSDARNLAIHELQSDWIGCCDADVILDTFWLERLWEKRTSGAVMITGNTQERIRSVGDLFRSITSPHNWGDTDVDNPYMVVPDQIALRKKLLEAGGYRTGLINYEDAEMCARLRESGHRFYYVASATAQHWRSDDFVTSLDLRYRHSLQRQIELLANESGLHQKIRNNIALATANFSKARLTANRRLEELCLLLPLHHLVMDLAEMTKRGFNFVPADSDRDIKQETETILLKFESTEWKAWWQNLENHQTHQIVQNFYDLYQKFLVQSDSNWRSSESNDTFALSDAIWRVFFSQALAKAQSLSQIGFSELPQIEADDHLDRAALPPSGVLYFRQPLFPSAREFWTCRDLTQFLAQRGKCMTWTETFQGSTVICFQTRPHHAPATAEFDASQFSKSSET